MNQTDDIDTQECVLSDQPNCDNFENDFFEIVDSIVEEWKVSDQHISTMMLMKDSELLNLLSSFWQSKQWFFFKHDIQNAIGGGGASALVTRAITGTDDSPTEVHPKDVNFHVSICIFARLLSRSEPVTFAEIISLSEDVVKDRNCRDKDATVSSNLKDSYLPSQLPTNYNFIVCSSSMPTLPISEEGHGSCICLSERYRFSL
jgi:hypothetical protein